MVYFSKRRIVGVTLIELLFVSGMFVAVLTMFLMLMSRTMNSQKQLDTVSSAATSLEVARLRLSELFRRSRLDAPIDFSAPAASVSVTLFQTRPDGSIIIDSTGQPVLGNSVDVGLDSTGNLTYLDGSAQKLLAALSPNATFEVERISSARVRVRLEVDGHQQKRRSLVFEAAFP